MYTAKEALERLREGNRRFVAGEQVRTMAEVIQEARERAVEGQQPFAVVLGCSDSRVPAELVFDQGLGDLFVIRVAGNVAASSQIGSVEYAAEVLGTRLVVVLGHSHCGAVQATIDAVRRPPEKLSPNLGAIVERIRPSVEDLVRREPPLPPEELTAEAVRAHVRAVVGGLRHASTVIEELEREQGLVIVGAEYCIESGQVDFLEEV